MEQINNELQTFENNNILEKNNSQTESFILITPINTENHDNTKKKMKKKKNKNKKSKKCKDLKELLEQINKEKKPKKIPEKISKNKEKNEIENIKENELFLLNSKTSKALSLEDSDKITDCDLTKENLYESVEVSDDKEKSKIDNINSIFFPSNSTKIEYFPEKNINYNNILNISNKKSVIENEQKLEKKRKMTYSFCDYFNGCDKYLSETEPKIIDLSTSNNFLKKENFYNFFYNNEIDDLTPINNKKDFYNFKEEKNLIHEMNQNEINRFEYSNGEYINFNDDFNSKFKLQPLITIPEIMNCDTQFSKFDDYKEYKTTYENENNNFYTKLNNNYYNKNKKENAKCFRNKSNKKKYSFFMRRRGDWLCEKCGNFNFAFRENCNRCNEIKPTI